MKKFGLIGRSLSHSFSKKYFNQKFLEEQIEASYLNYELNDLDTFRDLFKDKSIMGLNVTIPYKEQVVKYLDKLGPIALELQAVNTILPIYHKDGSINLKGFNTDVFGFHQSIKPYLKSNHQKALVLGTGGASKAVAYVLKQYGIDVNFISRSNSGNSPNVFSWETVNENMIKYHPLIVNTTPVGMYPNMDDKIIIPYEAITQKHLLIDLIYHPQETYFLNKGKEQGAQCINGYSMLMHQAVKAWDIWNI